MRVSYNWLKNYVNFDYSPEELSIILTDIGLEIEDLEFFESVRGGLKGIVTGEVVHCLQHPNADKLKLTRVNIGAEDTLDIVCGAPNVAEGQKVLVATVGTKLFFGDDEITIKKTKIRGSESFGMICAEDELGLGSSHDGIMVLDESVEVGRPATDYFEITNDWVYTIGLTPNRIDAASHMGVARDIAAYMSRVSGKVHEILRPDLNAFKIDNQDLPIVVNILDVEKCKRYSGLSISGIEVKESPKWLQNSLNAIGIRPINNIVDITNYVLMEYGQPLHAFDVEAISGHKVEVKCLEDKTSFTTLDEQIRKLNSNDLMICNDQEGMCIAGVFGGISSGVNTNTKNIFLESAYFDATSVRKTARRHQLNTDASFRFERGSDPNITVEALKRATMMIVEIAGGKVSSDIVDVYPIPINDWTIEVSYEYVTKLIGEDIGERMIEVICNSLEMEFQHINDQVFSVKVPTFKVDVTRPADVVEEILRVFGYNQVVLPAKLNSSISDFDKPDSDGIRNLVSDHLSSKGFVEVMNNSLTSSKNYENQFFNSELNVSMLNALSQDLNVLRQDLVFGGLESISYNKNRKQENFRFYEFGNVYSQKTGDNEEDILSKYIEKSHLAIWMSGNRNPENWYVEAGKLSLFDLKEAVNSILIRLGINAIETNELQSVNYLDNGLSWMSAKKTVAEAGMIRSELLAKFDLEDQEVYYAQINWDVVFSLLNKKEAQYKPLNKFPFVRRDLSILIDEEISFDQIREVALKAERKLLKSVNLFDVYQGKNIDAGKKSYALSFILEDEVKTLTDKLIDKTMRRITSSLERELNAQLRG